MTDQNISRLLQRIDNLECALGERDREIDNLKKKENERPAWDYCPCCGETVDSKTMNKNIAGFFKLIQPLMLSADARRQSTGSSDSE